MRQCSIDEKNSLLFTWMKIKRVTKEWFSEMLHIQRKITLNVQNFQCSSEERVLKGGSY